MSLHGQGLNRRIHVLQSQSAVSLIAAMNSQNDRNFKEKTSSNKNTNTMMLFDSFFHEKTINISVEDETDSDHSS